MQLSFQQFGSGFPLLILHGLLGSSDNWQTLARKLGQHFHIFTLDLRNHGRSPHDDAFNYSVMAGDLHEFLAAHQLPRCHLLGHSMGGKTAMHFALRFPRLVEKLIVVDIAPRAYPPLHTSIFNALLPLDLSRFQSRDEISTALAPSIPEPAVRQFLLKNVGRDDSGAFRWKMNLSVIHRNYDGLNQAIDSNTTCDRPTLFLRGSRSDYIQDADADLIHRLFPAAKIATIPNSGHWIQADAPEAFHSAVLEFLR